MLRCVLLFIYLKGSGLAISLGLFYGNVANILRQGYALIEYATLDEASQAIQNLNGSKLLEQTIHVDYAFVRPPPSGRNKAGAQGASRGEKNRNRSRSRSRSPGADGGRD